MYVHGSASMCVCMHLCVFVCHCVFPCVYVSVFLCVGQAQMPVTATIRLPEQPSLRIHRFLRMAISGGLLTPSLNPRECIPLKVARNPVRTLGLPPDSMGDPRLSYLVISATGVTVP